MNAWWDIQPGSLKRYSEHGWLIGCSSSREAQKLVRNLNERVGGHARIELGLSSVMVYSPSGMDEDDMREVLDGVMQTENVARGTHHRIEVCLDGEDLEEICSRTSLNHDALAEDIAGQSLSVATMGFSPGFGYLSGLSGVLGTLGRRDNPRPRVPAGSLAVAAGFAAIYPGSSPGGWWLLGHTNRVMFRSENDPPALLSPGDSVSLSVVSSLPRAEVRRAPLTRRLPNGVTPVVEVIAAPPGTAIVDDGRVGYQRFGVPVGGALDPERARVARDLVGGAPGALEITGAGLELLFWAPTVVALVDSTALLDGRSVPSGVPVSVSGGQRLDVISVGRGLRGYLAYTGGPIVEPVLGSMGTDSLAGIGPGFLVSGDLLGDNQEISLRLPNRGGVPLDPSPLVLRVTKGPQFDVLESGQALHGFRATVSSSSNRVGVRLKPAGEQLRRHPGEMASCPMITGALQLPPTGDPILLGPDHATLGGYPVVAVVIEADLGALGRLSPGEEVIIDVVSQHQAVRADILRLERQGTFVRGTTRRL